MVHAVAQTPGNTATDSAARALRAESRRWPTLTVEMMQRTGAAALSPRVEAVRRRRRRRASHSLTASTFGEARGRGDRVRRSMFNVARPAPSVSGALTCSANASADPNRWKLPVLGLVALRQKVIRPYGTEPPYPSAAANAQT